MRAQRVPTDRQIGTRWQLGTHSQLGARIGEVELEVRRWLKDSRDVATSGRVLEKDDRAGPEPLPLTGSHLDLEQAFRMTPIWRHGAGCIGCSNGAATRRTRTPRTAIRSPSHRPPSLASPCRTVDSMTVSPLTVRSRNAVTGLGSDVLTCSSDTSTHERILPGAGADDQPSCLQIAGAHRAAVRYRRSRSAMGAGHDPEAAGPRPDMMATALRTDMLLS